MRLHRLLSITVGIFLGTLSIQAAQTQSTATVTGTVTDPSGAAVMGADIDAVRIAQPASATTGAHSGPDGKFSIDLPP